MQCKIKSWTSFRSGNSECSLPARLQLSQSLVYQRGKMSEDQHVLQGHLHPPELPEDQTLISQPAPRAISFCLTLTSSRCSPCSCTLVFPSLDRQSCWIQIYCHFPHLRHPLPFSCCPISLLLCLVCPSHTLSSLLQRLEHSHCHWFLSC